MAVFSWPLPFFAVWARIFFRSWAQLYLELFLLGTAFAFSLAHP